MRFLNFATSPLTRNRATAYKNVIIDDAVEQFETEIAITLDKNRDAIVISPAESIDEVQTYDNNRDTTINNLSFAQEGVTGDLFNGGETEEDEDLVWIAADSIRIINGMDVKFGLITLDEAILVCLHKGSFEIQVDADGETGIFSRGYRGDPEKRKYMSASSDNFEGIPEYYLTDTILNVTLNRRLKDFAGGVRGLDTRVKIDFATSAWLDDGARYTEKVAEDAKNAKLEETKRLREEQEEIERSQRQSENIDKLEKARNEASKKASKTRTSCVEVGSTSKRPAGRNKGAAAFLSANS